jgi:hypothetical protein
MKDKSSKGAPVSGYRNKRIISGALAILVGTFAVSGCSPSPTSTNNNNQSGMSVEAQAAFTSMYSNEEDFKDSEEVASSNSQFNTKALGVDLGAIVNTDLKNLAGSLSANIDISADLLVKIGRPNYTVKTSTVASNKNSDGSTSKTMRIEYTSKTSGKKEADTVALTTFINGSTKVEHYLTASTSAYSKTAIRTANNDNIQKSVTTKSTATLSNQSTVEINEVRSGSQGSGTISITSAGGNKTNYTFNSNVSSDGKLTVDAKNTADNSTVNIVQNTDTTASATTNINGKASTSSINTEFDSESSLSAG